MKKTGLIIANVILFVLFQFAITANHIFAADVASIKLKFASISSPTHVLNTNLHEPWIKQIEKASNGKVNITLFTGGALGKAKQAYDIATSGIADISYGWVFYHPGRFPLTEAYTLPGLVPNIEAAYYSWDVYQKYLQKEWSEVKLLWLGVAPGYIFITKNKQIKAVDDVKGMKFGCLGKIAADVVLNLGGVPVDVTAQDAYVALQRGVIEGYINTWASTASNKHGEVAKYFTNAGLFNSIFFCVMNRNKYKSLPNNIRKIIDDNSGQSMFKAATKAYWDFDAKAIKAVMEQTGGKGVIYGLPKSEVIKYRKLINPIWNEWTKNMRAKNLPGEEVLKMMSGFLDK